jgi:hypothetical protein
MREFGVESIKPSLDFDRIQVGETFGPLEYSITAEKLELYRQAVEDPDAVFATIAAKDYSTLLRTRYTVDKIVNARHQSQYLIPPAVGTTIRTSGQIVDKYEKREHKFLVVETRSVDEAGRTLVISRTTLMDGAPRESR